MHIYIYIFYLLQLLVEMDQLSDNSNIVQVSKYRWIVLLLFCLYAAINFVQFLQYTIIGNIIERYYDVEGVFVDLSGLIFMISTIVLSGPANYLIRHYDLKKISILCSGLTTTGNLLKLASISQDRYYIVMISQFVCSLGQVLVLNIPTKLASLWFGRKQVSTACAIAVLGTQIGLAIGLIVPSNFVTNSKDFKTIEDGLWTMQITNASVSAVIFLLVLLFFRAKPEFPPSLSQANLVEDNDTTVFVILKTLLTNKDYVLIALIFGIANGLISFIGIAINDIYLHYFPNSEKDVGIISCITTLAGGCFGSVFFGYLLDRWHRFKLVSFIITFVPFLILILMTYILEEKIKLATYFILPLFGFFLTSTLVVGFEFGTEVTYPLPEVASCSVLNATIYIFAIIFTLSLGNLFDVIGYINVNIIIGVLLLISTCLIYFVNPTLKRLEANTVNSQVIQDS